MDWDAKMLPSWDLGTVVGPSSGGGGGVVAGGGGALDLKLGGPTSWKAAATAAPLPPPSSSAPAKRPRAGQAQQAVPACSVEGCAADLSKCREYHRRHKVCEAHSKTPVVTVAGQQQRFCQQCSRFHLLGEFDEVKRSCRKRLDGHNRRRRKPQPDPLNPGSLFTNHHGMTRFASYPQLFSAATMAEPKWPATVVKTESDAYHDQYYPAIHLNGAASLYPGKEKKHFPFLTDHGGSDAAAFGCQPFAITPSLESSSKQSNGNCALSLLSDNQTPAQMLIPTAQPLGAALQYGNVARLTDDGDVSLTGMSYVRAGDKQTSILATSVGHTAAAAAAASPAPASAAAAQLQQYHGYYHVSGVDHQGNPDGAAIQALPFSSW